MTSERPGFPLGLTLAAAAVVGLCCGLGAWQLQRAQWKAHVLAEIAARRDRPPQPIGPVLQQAIAGRDVSFTRVTANCGASDGGSFKPSAQGGEWVWHAIAECRLAGPFSSIAVDRGVVTSSRGSTSPPSIALPSPRSVTGVLQPMPSSRDATASVEAPYLLVAERENPAPASVTPVSGELDAAPQTLQYVGTYAPTWFGLGVVAASFYAAMLWRRRRPKR